MKLPKKEPRYFNRSVAGTLSKPLMFALAGLSAISAWGGDEDLYFGSLPVVATVSRLPQAQADAPGSVTVIDKELIRASGARNISDLLRLVPGFQVTPPNTDAPRVTYHGLGNEDFSPRVQVLLDGRSQYSPLFLGGVNWNTLPVALEDIARIEVVRGSNSAAFGSNAFLGVVNIITLDASQARGGVVELSHGTQGVRDQFLRWGGRVGGADMRISFKQQADDGYFFKPKNASDPSDIADNFRQQQVDFRADIPVTDGDQLQLGFGGLRNKLNTGRADEVFNPPRKLDQGTGYVHADWRRSLDTDQEIGFRYFHAEEEVDDQFKTSIQLSRPRLTLPFSIDKSGHSSRDDLEFQHTLRPAEAMRLVWGAGMRWDSVRQPAFFSSRDEINRSVSRLFGHLEWRLAPMWLVNLGGNWEHDNIGGTTFAPRLNISYQPLAGQTLRAGISRAYRTPSAYEVYGDQRIIPDQSPIPLSARNYLGVSGLKPERVDGLDFGYLGDFASYRTSIDIRVFLERIGDRIVTVERTLTSPNCEANPTDRDWKNPPAIPGCGHADYAVNGQQVTIGGIEYQWRWQPWESTRLLVNQAFTSFSQSQDAFITSDPDAAGKIERQTLASAPHRSSSAMLMQKLPYGVQFSAIQHWVGEMRWTSNSMVPAYRRLDLRLAYPFRLGANAGEVAVVSQSANGDHAEFRDTRIIKERHWVSLRFDY